MTTAEQPSFELKHRIVGAAVLLFFGALFLPWLLGPPNELDATSATLGSDEVISDLQTEGTLDPRSLKGSESTSFIALNSTENQPSLANETGNSDLQERVYISKITPLDGKPTVVRTEPAVEFTDTPRDPVTSTAASIEPSLKSSTNEVDKQPILDVSVNDPSNNNTAASIATEGSTIESTVPPVQAQNTEGNQSKVNSTPESTVDVGWIVQVGVFTDSKGAEKVVEDLSSKGFKASTSIVDTNRGKGTGTRVWLGPFAQRIDAAKTKTQLTETTGEPGFIRVYP